jgi:ferredoxin
MSEKVLGTIRIDASRCEGHGRCYTLSPELFASDDVGTGLVVNSEVTAETIEAAKHAVASCPEDAIVFEQLDSAP